jgi:hypothetical protein
MRKSAKNSRGFQTVGPVVGAVVGTCFILLYAESIELFIDDKAFSLLYAPRPPSALISCQQVYLSFSVFLSSLLTGEGEGMGEEPNHTTARKPCPP